MEIHNEGITPISRMKKLFKWCLLIGLAFLGFIIIWVVFDLPPYTSVGKFRKSLYTQVEANAPELKLADMMEGNWELACDSHGYGGPVRIAKYNRSYEPVGDADDKAWGMIFIFPDGSYKGVTGRCRKGGVDPDLMGCWDRDKAILHRREPAGYDECPRYTRFTAAEQQQREDDARARKQQEFQHQKR